MLVTFYTEGATDLWVWNVCQSNLVLIGQIVKTHKILVCAPIGFNKYKMHLFCIYTFFPSSPSLNPLFCSLVVDEVYMYFVT